MRGVGVLLILLLCLSRAAADPATDRLTALIGPATVPHGLGVNLHLTRALDRDAARLRDLDASVARSDLLWSAIETGKGVYRWEPYDRLVGAIRQAGAVPLLILAYANPVYGRRGHRARAPIGTAARAAYVRFAAAAARRYRGVIWEIWNEPNLNFGRPFRQSAYIALALEACRAIHAADPSAAVIAPASSQMPFGFLRALVRADSARCLDAVSVHPYRSSHPERALRDWQALRRITRDRTLVVSEWGYSATRKGRTVQAAFVPRIYLADLIAGIPLTVIYDLRDDGHDPRNPEHNFGLLDYAGAPKPAYRAIRDLVVRLHGMRYLGLLPTRARRRDFVAAFGASEGPRVIVAWTTARPHALALGTRSCVAGACLGASRTIAVTGRPAIRAWW